jgi:hypothetical protein
MFATQTSKSVSRSLLTAPTTVCLRSAHAFHNAGHPWLLESRNGSQTFRRVKVVVSPRKEIPGLTIKGDFKGEGRQIVGEFNRAIAAAHRALYSDKVRERLWKAYLALQSHDRSLVTRIPDAAFRYLYRSQSTWRPDDATRLPSLKVLVNDMRFARLGTINDYESFLKVELDFASGNQLEALGTWAGRVLGASDSGTGTSASASSQTFPTTLDRRKLLKTFGKEWLELGGRLHAEAGDMESAKEILGAAARRFKNIEPRFIVLLIRQLTATGTTANLDKAWVRFTELRRLKTFDMSFSDYESVYQSFLSHPKGLVMAATTLKLLIGKFGQVGAIEHRVFGDLLRLVYLQCDNQEEVDAISIALLEKVPTGYPSDKFYEYWMQRTMQLSDPEHMAKIIELMFENGQRPQAWQITNLLQRSMDSTTDGLAANAEALAWKSIAKRVEVFQHERTQHTTPIEPPDTSMWRAIPAFVNRAVRPASRKTYVQLMDYYAAKQDSETTRTVLHLLMTQSGLELNDQMVRSILAIHFTMNDTVGAWEFFSDVRKRNPELADLATYRVLWKGLHMHLSGDMRQSRKGYPDARGLFRSMLMDVIVSNPEASIPFGEQLPATLYERIVKCFVMKKDPTGLQLALETMHELFGNMPTVKTVETLLVCLAESLARLETQQGFATTVETAMMKQVRTLDQLRSKHTSESPADIFEVARGLMTRFLDTIPARKLKGIMDTAREQMGLHDLSRRGETEEEEGILV